jgi:hypothetical protein
VNEFLGFLSLTVLTQEAKMKRTFTIWVRETKGDFVHPECLDNRHCRLSRLLKNSFLSVFNSTCGALHDSSSPYVVV